MYKNFIQLFDYYYGGKKPWYEVWGMILHNTKHPAIICVVLFLVLYSYQDDRVHRLGIKLGIVLIFFPRPTN